MPILRPLLLLFPPLLAVMGLVTPMHAQDRLPRIHYPAPLGLWEWQKTAGLTLSTLPKEIVEEELNQSPALDLHSRVGLPWGFSANTRALVQVLTNHVTLGGSWSHAFGRFALTFGDDAAFWFGFLTIEGFDNSANGWLNYPYVTVGYDFGRFRLSMRTEALLVLSFRSYAGDHLLASDKNGFGGLAVTFAIEQPFWKDTHVALSFKASYLRYFYQSWFTYETFNRYLFIPELAVGFFL